MKGHEKREEKLTKIGQGRAFEKITPTTRMGGRE